jgi:hypothetical protein
MRLPYTREARCSRSPTEEILVHSSDLFKLTLGALALAVAVSSPPPLQLPAPAPSLPAPGR